MRAMLIIIVPTQLKQTGITTSLLKGRLQQGTKMMICPKLLLKMLASSLSRVSCVY